MCLDPRDLICHVCGKKYHVDNYDPDSPSAYSCIDCYKKNLEKTEFCEPTISFGPMKQESEEMIVYVAEYWDDEYGCPGGAIGVARTFKGALDILAGYEMKEFETKIVSQKIIPYGDGSHNKYVKFIDDDGFFSSDYSIREMELNE